MRYALALALTLLFASPAAAQYGRPYYYNPYAAVQWQYRQAYGFNPAAVQRQRAYRNWQYEQYQQQVNRYYRANPQAWLDEQIRLRVEAELRNRGLEGGL